jgi:transposase
VCHPAAGGTHWNATFKAFAAYWSFEPRLCQPYRAQTKPKTPIEDRSETDATA